MIRENRLYFLMSRQSLQYVPKKVTLYHFYETGDLLTRIYQELQTVLRDCIIMSSCFTRYALPPEDICIALPQIFDYRTWHAFTGSSLSPEWDEANHFGYSYQYDLGKWFQYHFGPRFYPHICGGELAANAYTYVAIGRNNCVNEASTIIEMCI